MFVWVLQGILRSQYKKNWQNDTTFQYIRYPLFNMVHGTVGIMCSIVLAPICVLGNILRCQGVVEHSNRACQVFNNIIRELLMQQADLSGPLEVCIEKQQNFVYNIRQISFLRLRKRYTAVAVWGSPVRVVVQIIQFFGCQNRSLIDENFVDRSWSVGTLVEATCTALGEK